MEKILALIEWCYTSTLPLSMLFIIDRPSIFCYTGGYFLSWHFTLYKFRKNIPTCNKICTSSKAIGFNSSEAALLLLEKVFSYRFSIYQWAKRINFKEITAVFQVLTRWIGTFKGSHLYIFCDNFAVTQELQKNSINREVM